MKNTRLLFFIYNKVLNTGHAGKSVGVVWYHGSGLPLQRRYLRPPLHDRILEQYRDSGHDRIL